MASTADYIKIAEGIKSNEISSRQKIEQLSSEISGVTGSINSARGQIDSLEASISAEMSRPYETDSEGNTYGGPNYAAISSMRSEIGALQGEIEGLMAQRAQLEGKRDEERAHLQEILIEKSATLSEVQSKAQDAATSIAAAGGMVGAYSGIGSNLANAFQGAHSNLAQAAGILGGSVAGVSAGGGGGSASGGSAAGIRGVPSQTRNTAAGMTTNGHGGGGRSMSGSSNRSASGASRGMKTNGAAKRSGTAGNFSTSQTSATAGAAFGIGAGTAGAVASANAGAPSAAKFTTSKTSAVGKSVKPSLFPVQTKHKPGLYDFSKKIDAIVEDMKVGSGKNISLQRAEEIAEAIEVYSGNGYLDIRDAYNNPGAAEYYKEQMRLVDEYLRAAPKWSGTILRGINVDEKTAEMLTNKNEIDMLGPASWSTDLDTAQSFSWGSKPVSIIFVLSNNKSAASITHVGKFGGAECEVTSPSGVLYTRERVENKVVDGREYTYIYVREGN